MQEIIKKIIEVDNYKEEDSWTHMAGFKIVTNEQEILLLIDDESSCCERWGYFWSDDEVKNFIGAEIQKIEIVDTALDKKILVKNNLDIDDEWFDGGVMFVNFETSKGLLQFTAYNEHNGYYGHEAKVISKQLKHKETL